MQNDEHRMALMNASRSTLLRAATRLLGPARAPATVGGVVQVGGQLGLLLALDGVALCVLPLGPRAEQAHGAVVG